MLGVTAEQAEVDTRSALHFPCVGQKAAERSARELQRVRRSSAIAAAAAAESDETQRVRLQATHVLVALTH